MARWWNRILVGDFTVVLSFAQNYTSFGIGWKASPDIEHHPTYQDTNVETGYNQEGVGPYPVRWYRYMRPGNAVSIAVSTSSAAGPWTVHASGTISTPSDKVLCMIGHIGRRCSDPARIISVTN
jgi:hypothetical protein